MSRTPWVLLASGSAALVYWGASQYTRLLQKREPWMEVYWLSFGAVMLLGLFSVAFLCRRATVTPRVSFALLALSTVAVMILYSLGRRSGPGIVESIGEGWFRAPVLLHLCVIGANGLFASFLLVVLVGRRSQHHG